MSAAKTVDEVLQSRRSVRVFTAQHVDEGVLH